MVVPDAATIGSIVYAAALYGLALGVLVVDPRNRLQRAFSLLVLIEAAILTCSTLQFFNPDQALFWAGLRGYLFVASGGAVLSFAALVAWRRRPALARGARLAILAATIALEVVYLLDHATVHDLRSNGTIEFLGPLGFVVQGNDTLAAAIALLFATRTPDSPATTVRRIDRLLALAFALSAVSGASTVWFFSFQQGLAARAAIGNWFETTFELFALPLALLAIALLVRESMARRARVFLAWTAILASASFLLPLVGYFGDPDLASGNVWVVSMRLAQLAFPLVAGYAVLRRNAARVDAHRIDRTVRGAMRGGTVGAIVVAMFFVVSEGAAALFGALAAERDLPDWLAQALGVLGAGVLVFALAPMVRWGERLANGVAAHGRPIAQMGVDEREQVYREQAEVAWADGSLSAKERLLLDALRQRLGIPIEAAANIEHEAAGPIIESPKRFSGRRGYARRGRTA